VTETCDPDAPHLLTHIATTPAPVPDTALTELIAADLVARDRAPTEHIVDSGYIDAANLVASHAWGIDLVGPPLADTSWQGRANQGFASGDFALDWDGHRATCPGGQTSAEWRDTTSRHGTPVVTIRFARTVCQTCPVRPACTHGMARTLTLRPQAEHQALQTARTRLTSGEMAAGLAARAGIEGTISQMVAVGGVRRARYRGLPKLHLAHLLTAVAINLLRLVAWWEDRPLAAARPPRFVRVTTAAPYATT
jgi:transposase